MCALSLPVRLTVRWAREGDRRYVGDVEEMLGYTIRGPSLPHVIAAITAALLKRGAR
ncbi:MAG: hypothetical protein HYR51_07415 [Candidatus Rokubacteria bacterium]|nr:hypothetical protein [Candidatus Rokubacteria bacterium]